MIAARRAAWRERSYTMPADDAFDCAAGYVERAQVAEDRALRMGQNKREREAWALAGALDAGEAWTAAVVHLLLALDGRA